MTNSQSILVFEKQTMTSSVKPAQRAALLLISFLLLLFGTPVFPQFTWHQATTPSIFTLRAGHAMVAHDNKLFIFSGESEGQSVPVNALCTSDGSNWTQLADTVGFKLGAFYGCVSFKGYIWIIGGKKIDAG